MKPTARTNDRNGVYHDTLPWLTLFSLDLMRKLLVLATVLLASCAEEPPATKTPTAPVQPHFIGNVKSISSGDMRTIVDLERDAIIKEFHSAPTSMTIRVINHNHVMVFFEVRGQQAGDPVDRIRGKWKRPGGVRATIVRLEDVDADVSR